MSLPIITVQQMRDWENATWASGETAANVIAKVGQIMAARALKLTMPDDTIVLLAGKGHNGDDARAALPHLSDRKTILIEVTDPRVALQHFTKGCATPPDLIIDGLFGIGLNRPLDNDWQHLIRAVNQANIPVLAIDIPSGLDADTGEIHGTAVRASVTLTLGAPKRGLLVASAIPFVGRLEVAAKIGFIEYPFAENFLWTNAAEFVGFPSTREISSHKGSFGHVAIMAGSLGFHGAAVLAARGALKARSGLVSLFTPENIYVPVASALQSAMVHPWRTFSEIPKTSTALLFGPGFAAPVLPENLKRELCEAWRQSPLPVVVDASALDWLPITNKAFGAIRVITPHPGEAARMLSQTTDSIQTNRSSTLRTLSARHGNCWVVLKGHQTLVGRSDGPIFVNGSGNPFLAQGGSGDVLSGFLTGLLAQPALQKDLGKTIRYAVWQHGATADRLSEAKRHWTIHDLIENLGENI